MDSQMPCLRRQGKKFSGEKAYKGTAALNYDSPSVKQEFIFGIGKMDAPPGRTWSRNLLRQIGRLPLWRLTIQLS